MKKWLSLALYNLLLLIFTLVDLTKWLVAIGKVKLTNSDANKIKRDWLWGQKFGLLPHGLPIKQATETRYLIHCASMGEVISAMPLILAMLEQKPQLSFVVTTNTLTGKEQTLKLIQQHNLSQRVFHTYLPIDLPWLARGLLTKSQADKLIIMEVELWPNLILAAQSLGLPSAIINGRLTDSSFRGYQKFSWLAQPMVSALSQVFVRNEKDFINYSNLGLSAPVLEQVGNIKFDIDLPALDLNKQWRERLNITDRLVIVAGSTHDGEETGLLDSFNKLQAQHDNLVLIIAPRHPHRFSDVTELMQTSGLNCINTSKGEVADSQTQIIILDQMGVLSEVYACADIVFIGGSIAKRGGHNPIEASAFAKPVIMGQHIYNNPEVINTLADSGGLIKVSDETELLTQLNAWLANPEQRLSVGEKGLNAIKQNSGVIAHLAQRL